MTTPLERLWDEMEEKNVRSAWKSRIGNVMNAYEQMEPGEWRALINKLADECVKIWEGVPDEEALNGFEIIIIGNNLIYMGMIARLREGVRDETD